MSLDVTVLDLRRISDIRIGRVQVSRRLNGRSAKFDAVLGWRIVKWRVDGVLRSARVRLGGGEMRLAFLPQDPFIVGLGSVWIEGGSGAADVRPVAVSLPRGPSPASTDTFVRTADLYPGWLSLPEQDQRLPSPPGQ